MKNTALIITVFAAILGTASVSFGDTKCATARAPKAGVQKLSELKQYLVVAGEDQSPQSIPNDPRRPLDRKQYSEYNSIGTLRSEIGRGTAWLGNECLVWTAKHVIGSDKKIIGKKVKFEVGQSSIEGKDFEYSIEGEVVASGNPNGTKVDSGSEDWALVKLNKSIGKKVGYIETAQYSVEDATTCSDLEVAGFPGEKSTKTLWAQKNCPLYTEDSDSGAFNIGCPVTRGNSGGPLLCREKDGSLVAIGIMNQRVKKDATKKGIAVNFTSEWPEAKAAYLKYKNSCN